MSPLLSANELDALRQVALLGMVTPVYVKRRITSDTAYGDDDRVTYTLVATTGGWFFSRPTPVADVDTGALITVNTYRLFVPVGTDILAGDEVSTDSDPSDSDVVYTVTDTTFESTWLPLLTCSLRKRE